MCAVGAVGPAGTALDTDGTECSGDFVTVVDLASLFISFYFYTFMLILFSKAEQENQFL